MLGLFENLQCRYKLPCFGESRGITKLCKHWTNDAEVIDNEIPTDN